MQRLTSTDLQAFMQERGIHGEMLHLDVPTPTVETAAQAVGTRVERIVKSILFVIEGQPVLAITCGTSYVDRRAIASMFSVGRKRVKLASAETVLEISGYEVGAMPPFGHLRKLPTLLDRGVLEHPEVYAGGGAENVLVRMEPEEILRATQAQVIELVEKDARENTDGDEQ
jgi:prolyl-tRNA editing enzyme YbaK/EbsC (Cys-tRNA(Pro) deacylase)